MKRPDKLIDELNATLQRPVVEYIAYLEGWIAATKEQRTGGRPAGKPVRAKTPFTSLCASCRFSRRAPAPEHSDQEFLVLCDEPTYGRGEHLIGQCRQLGPCGPKAVLRQEREA